MHVIVVGGGAAGMMAALAAARTGAKVTLLEKNEKLGKKIYITGKGRCNLTNASDMETVMQNVRTNPRFLYSAFSAFDNRAVIGLFESLGMKTKTERGNRVFPQSDHASDVTAALQRELVRLGVKIRLHIKVTELLTEPWQETDRAEDCVAISVKPAAETECGGSAADGEKMDSRMYGEKAKRGKTAGSGVPRRRICGVRTETESVRADRVIVATGGLSYPSTGSDGDGYRFAKADGHRVIESFPALVPLEVAENDAKELQGLSLKNVELTVRDGKKTLYCERGEMLFTHFGVSGPLVLGASSFLTRLIHEKKKRPLLEIDLKPALSAQQLDKRLLREFDAAANKQFKNVLPSLLPAKLVPVIMARCGISGDKKINEITRVQREELVRTLKKLTYTVTGTRGFAEAVITQGGVSVRDMNPSTMESKRVKGLYFAGETLDVDALTGGYNLQIAWSTGYLAGKSAAKEAEFDREDR